MHAMPLADACVTEWREISERYHAIAQCHSLMLVLLNGGARGPRAAPRSGSLMPLADACVTEWRRHFTHHLRRFLQCHSLMLVLLNGGATSADSSASPTDATR